MQFGSGGIQSVFIITPFYYIFYSGLVTLAMKMETNTKNKLDEESWFSRKNINNLFKRPWKEDTYMSHELAEVAGIVGESVHENDGNGDIDAELGNF